MEKSPKVSVCIPVYNCEKYIGEAIESVLQQTFTDFELIIVDNNSTDGTLQVIQKYAEQDKRIAYYRNETNLGVISNWNLTVVLARGEYIKMLCSDDKLMPRCLEVFVNKLNENRRICLITSFTQCMGDSDDIKSEKEVYAVGEIDGKELQKNLLFTGNWIGSPTTVMFRRKDLHIGLFNHVWSEFCPDLDFWIRLLSIGNAYVVPEILSLHRTHNESRSATCNIDFAYIRERLKFVCFAFQFPNMYGRHTEAERIKRTNHILERLIREGFDRKGLKPKLTMLKIGLSKPPYSRIKFCLLILKNIRRLFFKGKRSN